MSPKDRMLQSVESEPWKFWSPRTRETIAFELSRLASKYTEDTQYARWSEYPIIRGDAEDIVRALRDIHSVIANTRHDDKIVLMGEESAP